MSERLVAAGFRRDAQSFVIWEGVSQYLSPDSISGVLEGISKTCARGSLMAFTYIHGGVLDGSGEFPEGRKLAKRAADAGEPWLFGIRPEHVLEFLRPRGLDLVEDFGSTQLVTKYLDPIGRSGPLPGFTHVAVARISRSDPGHLHPAT